MIGSAIVVEDDTNTALALAKVMSSIGYSVRIAGTLKEAQSLLRDDTPDVVLLDVTLPDGDGLDLMKDKEKIGSAKFVIITGDSTQEVAVRSLRSNAADFLVKPVSLKDLKATVKNITQDTAASHQENNGLPETMAEVRSLMSNISADSSYRSDVLLTGDSRQAQDLDESIQRLAESNKNVVISGEAGVDKLSAAYALHRRTPRSMAIFIIQCATGNVNVSNNQVINGFSECLSLAFSGAGEDKCITLVLDDPELLAVSKQRELLGYLSAHSVLATDQPGRPRVVSIQRSFEQYEQDSDPGKTRNAIIDELGLCLDQFKLEIPPLRRRRKDIRPMSEKILAALNERHNTKRVLKEDAFPLLASWDWQGNVRELSNVIGQAYNATDYVLDIAEILTPTRTDATIDKSVEAFVGKSFWELEKALLQATLLAHEGNKITTAKTLGISLKTLYNRLNAYSISY